LWTRTWDMAASEALGDCDMGRRCSHLSERVTYPQPGTQMPSFDTGREIQDHGILAHTVNGFATSNVRSS
jgi:hypothetical protein